MRGKGKGSSAGLREISIGAVFVSVLAGALLGCVARETPSATEPVRSALSSSTFVPAGFGCAWHDEFGGDQGLGQARADLDATSWSFHELNDNGEQQVYTTKQCLGYPNNWNYCIEDGRLRVQGRNESVTCDTNGDGVSDNPVCAPNYGNGFHAAASYTSGRLMSKHKVHFHDGYLEFRVKLPDAARAGLPESGMWPAVWMLGENITQGPTPGSVDWPGCGEVDVMEYSTSGGASKQGWNAIWAGPGGTNACSSWPQGGNAACGPCDTTGGQCVGAVVNGTPLRGGTGWPNFDNHSWHTYGFPVGQHGQQHDRPDDVVHRRREDGRAPPRHRAGRVQERHVLDHQPRRPRRQPGRGLIQITGLGRRRTSTSTTCALVPLGAERRLRARRDGGRGR